MKRLSTAPGTWSGLSGRDRLVEGDSAQVAQVFPPWPCSPFLSLQPGLHSGLSRKGRSVSWKISLTPTPYSIRSFFLTDSRTKSPDEEEEEEESS